MNPSTEASQNGILKTHTCPVCNTANKGTNVHCSTCSWYFPLKETPQFALELSRAKQQFQMISSFNQVYQHMQIQSKMLEKMSFRLDGLEGDMKNVKEQNFIIVNPDSKDSIEYPELQPILTAENFDTPEKRATWWKDLEEQWKKAFNSSFFQKGEVIEMPNDKEIKELFNCPTFRVVGPRGMYPSITFELTNLSGLKHLTNLQYLFVTHCALTDLKGIEHLNKVECLYVNSNKLVDIQPVYYLKKLDKLYINANQIVSIMPVKELKLSTLYCNYNRLVNFHGISTIHKGILKEFYCLPNDEIDLSEVKRLEQGLNIKCAKA